MREFTSTNGFKILVGQNSRENSNLTLKIADQEDLFFHVSDYPGSHVILCLSGGVPLNADLLDAACLAAHFSKARNKKSINVDYTSRSNISRPRKAPAGLVELAKFKTIRIKAEEARIQKYIK